MTHGRSLFIAPTMPALSGNGLAMRLSIFLEALARLGPVDLIVLPAAGGHEVASVLPETLNVTTRILSLEGRWDSQFALTSRVTNQTERLASFRRYGRPSLSAATSAAILGDIARLTGSTEYRLAHVGRCYLGAVSTAIGLDVPITLDLDEDDVTSCRQQAVQLNRDGRTAEAAWMEVEAEGYVRLQQALPDRFDRLFISSEVDRGRIIARTPNIEIDLIENAVALPVLPTRRDDGRTVVFVGSFGYAPNVAGCLWFVAKAWPLLRAALPDVRLRLVGRDPPTEIRALSNHAGIEVVGPVDFLADVYATATLAIAPLHAGAGTRIKILEAASFQVPVVATALAAAGLLVGAPDTLWVADDPQAFAASIVEALANPSERQRRARLAYEIVAARYDRTSAVDLLASRFRDVITTVTHKGGNIGRSGSRNMLSSRR